MIIDNFNRVREHLKFPNKDTFYFIQILKRKKDNPDVPSNHNNNKRSIRTYYIYSMDYFNSIEKEIITLCEATNSRAYIHMSPRSYKKTAFTALSEMTKSICAEEYTNSYKMYNTACGMTESLAPGKKLFLIDIDTNDFEVVEGYKAILNETPFTSPDTIVCTIPTINGFHIICKPFNVRLFEGLIEHYNMPMVDIHKNNPTLLYFNDKVQV